MPYVLREEVSVPWDANLASVDAHRSRDGAGWDTALVGKRAARPGEGRVPFLPQQPNTADTREA